MRILSDINTEISNLQMSKMWSNGADEKRGRIMSAEEMLKKVQDLKEECFFNGFAKTEAIDKFFDEYWLQILDMLDDALYAHLQGKI